MLKTNNNKKITRSKFLIAISNILLFVFCVIFLESSFNVKDIQELSKFCLTITFSFSILMFSIYSVKLPAISGDKDINIKMNSYIYRIFITLSCIFFSYVISISTFYNVFLIEYFITLPNITDFQIGFSLSMLLAMLNIIALFNMLINTLSNAISLTK
ncbi:hypothetical protein [Anaerosphaera aminiphila]|uniref:hypothetical protein n=1 Tax=Anaerosphaera aminiphila TaxID=1120994 RepID=UPI001177D3FB|nr:hypothetical protein [Anaerosphaera aminiphila]